MTTAKTTSRLGKPAAASATSRKRRPRDYTKAMAERILRRLGEGETLRAITADESMPSRKTVAGWVTDDVEGFADRFARARDLGLDHMADELLHIADTPAQGVKVTTKGKQKQTIIADMVERARLRVDSRKWYLSKLAPKRYSEKGEPGAQGGDSAPEPRETTEVDRAMRITHLISLAMTRMTEAERSGLHPRLIAEFKEDQAQPSARG